MGVVSRPITLSRQERQVLESWLRSRSLARPLQERAHIVLMSSEGVPNQEQASRLGVDVQRVWRWRNRWAAEAKALWQAQEAGATTKDLASLILRLLSDRHRSGRRSRFSAEQVAQLIAVACEAPDESGLPVSHWTSAELAQEVNLRPHKTRTWLNPKIEDPVLFAEQTQTICKLYHDAPSLLLEGVHVVSADEKTGMQAKERIAPTKPARRM